MPYVYMGRERGLKPHPYCTECGLVKSLSPEKPRGIGYYINIMTSLKNDFNVTNVQVRLVVKELEELDVDDGYGMNRLQQEELFIEVIRKYINVPEWKIRNLL